MISDEWTMAADSQLIEGQATIKQSLHGREILAATSLQVSAQEVLLVTGSEDTYLKVSLLNLQTQ